MHLINVLSWFSDKIEKFGAWFKQFVDKYIGSGISAMLIVLVLIFIGIIVIRKFTSK